ncbi:MAG: hypothetical protein P8I83_02835 [Paracoccaceae bacterium]|nr:hypothetical protein [Paracoccaceae bacterium]
MSDAEVSRKGVQKTDYESSKANTDDVYIGGPCANTVQGLTPAPDAISDASPRLKSIRPITSIKTDSNDGYIVRGLGELQKSVGTDLILKNCTVFSCNHKNL